jgi:hypothetical protein
VSAAASTFAVERVLHGARLQALRGEVEPGFDVAIQRLRQVGSSFRVATALLEQAEWLAWNDRHAETAALLDEAGATFEHLGAAPSLERVAALRATAAPGRP